MAIRVDARNVAALSSYEPFVAPWMVPGMTDPQADNADKLELGAAMAAARGVPFYLNGQVWAASRKLYFPTRANIQDGCFDYRALPPIASNNNYLLNIEGSISTYVATLAVDALADEGTPQTITLSPGDVAGLGGLANGDMLFITGVGQPWFQNATSQIPTGQEITVKEVAGEVVTMYGALRYSFAAGAQIRKVAPVEDIILKDIDLIGSGTLVKDTILKQGGINLNFYRRALIENVNVDWVNLYGVLLNNGSQGRLTNSTIQNTPGWYGVGLAGPGSNNIIDKSYLLNNRHGFTATGSSYGIPTDFIVDRNKCHGREAGLDAHPGCDKGTYSNNDIDCVGDVTENTPHGLFLQGRAMYALDNRIRGNVAGAVYYQPATLASTGLKGVLICRGNNAESRNVRNTGLYAYTVQTGAGPPHVKCPVGTIDIDSSARGNWAGLVRLQANNGADIEPGWRVRGSGSEFLTTGVQLAALNGNPTYDTPGANIRRGTISVDLTMADPTGDFGIGLQATTNQNGGDHDGEVYSIDAVVSATTVTNAKTALRRLGAVGGRVNVKADIVTDAANLIESFQPADAVFINGYGVRKYANDDYDLTPADAGWTISNEGATGTREFRMYPGGAGLHQHFVCAAEQDMNVWAAPNGVIWLDGVASATGGYITASTIGAMVSLYSQNGVDWYATGNSGWSIGTDPGPAAYFWEFMEATDLPAELSMARAAGPAGYFDADVNYQNAAPDTPRFNHLSDGSRAGLHYETAALGTVRTSDWTGAVSGSPGTAPATMNITDGASNGLTRTITTGLTANGMKVLRVGWVGVPIADQTVAIAFENTAGAGAAANGQTWTNTFYARQTEAGSWENVYPISNVILQLDSGGTAVGISLATTIEPTTDPIVEQRFINTRVLSGGGSVAKCVGQFRMPVHAGLPVNIEVEVALGNTNQEGRSSSPIESSGSALTRQNETLTATVTPGTYKARIVYRGAVVNVPSVDASGGTWVVPKSNNREVQSISLYLVS